MQKRPPRSPSRPASNDSRSDRPDRARPSDAGDRPARPDRTGRREPERFSNSGPRPGAETGQGPGPKRKPPGGSDSKPPRKPRRPARTERPARKARPAMPTGPAAERILFHQWLDMGPLPPPIDRFLSYHVRPQKIPDAAERKRLTQWMLATQRYGMLALFCQWLLLDAPKRDAFLAAPSEEILAAYEAQVPTPADFFGVLRSVDLDVFTGWIRHLSAFAPAPAYIGRYGPLIREALAKLGTPRAALLAAGVPTWYAPAWSRRLELGGFDAAAFLERQNSTPGLWVRPRQDADVAAALTAEGFEVTAEDAGLRVVGERSLYTTDAHRAGLFEIQDLGSQQAGGRVACKPGDWVWDACAGAGGKTLQIASALRERGVVYASDVRGEKLEILKQRARRVGTSNVRTQTFDGNALPEFPAEVRKHGGFDWVLIDAPCTSSGTWRRNPDARLRNSPDDAREVARIQRRLVALACEAVKPGGHLVYLTCSWLAEENEDIADEFGAAHPEFELVDRGFHGCPGADADTLFGATWRRRPAG